MRTEWKDKGIYRASVCEQRWSRNHKTRRRVKEKEGEDGSKQIAHRGHARVKEMKQHSGH